MITFRQFLEKYTPFASDWGKVDSIHVFTMPSTSEIDATFRRSKAVAVRFFEDPKHKWYCWPADEAIHSEIASYLGCADDDRSIIVSKVGNDYVISGVNYLDILDYPAFERWAKGKVLKNKDNQILNEFRTAVGNIDVYRNPRGSELDMAFNRSQYKEVRFMKIGKDWYCWPGEDMLHYKMAAALGFKASDVKYGMVIRRENKDLYVAEIFDASEEDLLNAINQPEIKRMFAGKKLVTADEYS